MACDGFLFRPIHAWYPHDFPAMPSPYPSPAPSDPALAYLLPSSGPARRRTSPDPYVPYDRRPRRPSPVSTGSSPSPSEPASAVPRPPRREQHRQTKHRLRDVDRKNICLYHVDHPHARQEDIGAAFNVERSTISKILKEKAKWLNISQESENCEHTSKHRTSKFPALEEDMRKALQAWAEQRVNITDHLIRTRALELAVDCNITPDMFKASSGWVENFKARHDIRRGEWPHAILYGPPHRGAVPTAQQTMGMGYDEHGNPRQAQQPGAAPIDADAAARAPGVHTPQQRHAALDPTAIQHSPDGYDAQREYHAQYPDAVLGHVYGHAAAAAGAAEPEEVILGVQGMPPPPTVEEADEAINIVIMFIDRVAPDGFLVPGERAMLGHVKCALFNLVSGMPYERPR
ncbi:hypothetical protein HYPSUDRAFT_39206 [Hypholoma sublateritium FD-334 SS-4]|uniref:HTH CENPB-type domain-containing protein n=1 Tax=Hypholoma sublateritium (strain FD-334 SS-4) TaxID=945553 RepID=A0A0D2MK52_HYPSF|nr:hypothetical protein HYPSUDRAFT_39206 [Hypholoma sublateritium FD-334 SS-4]